MKCPLYLRDVIEIGGIKHTVEAIDCNPECAWAFEWNDKVSCAIAIRCVGMQGANAQPMERDVS